MKEEMLKLLRDIKTVLADRMDALTADGVEVSDALLALEVLINKAKEGK